MYAVVEIPGNGLEKPQAAGPFETVADAEMWARMEELATQWVIVELYDPSTPPF